MVRTLQCYTLSVLSLYNGGGGGGWGLSVLSLYNGGGGGGGGGGNLCMKRLWIVVVLLSGVNHNGYIFFSLPSVMYM